MFNLLIIVFQCCGETINFDQNEILPSTKNIKTSPNVDSIVLTATSGNDELNKSEVSFL